MKNLSRLLFLSIFLLSFSYASASSAKSTSTGSTKESNFKQQTKDIKNNENSLSEDQKTEQKNETEKKEEEKAKLLKDMNSLLVDGYKVKFVKILDGLEDKVRLKKKEDKIKIFSNVLYSVNTKIELINSDKVNITENRKEVLNGVLGFIKDYTQAKIEDFAKEK